MNRFENRIHDENTLRDSVPYLILSFRVHGFTLRDGQLRLDLVI